MRTVPILASVVATRVAVHRSKTVDRHTVDGLEALELPLWPRRVHPGVLASMPDTILSMSNVVLKRETPAPDPSAHLHSKMTSVYFPTPIPADVWQLHWNLASTSQCILAPCKNLSGFSRCRRQLAASPGWREVCNSYDLAGI